MKHLTVLGAAMVLSTALAAPASAAVTVLTFDTGCEQNDPCVSGDFFAQSYGDSAEIGLSHRALDGAGAGSVVETGLRNYDLGYGDLVGVAWSNAFSSVGEITFDVLQPDISLSLLSLDTAGWFGDYETAFRIYDLSYNLLYDSGVLTTPYGADHLWVDLQGVTSTSGLRLQWEDAYLVAIDNLAFSVGNPALKVGCIGLLAVAHTGDRALQALQGVEVEDRSLMPR